MGVGGGRNVDACLGDVKVVHKLTQLYVIRGPYELLYAGNEGNIHSAGHSSGVCVLCHARYMNRPVGAAAEAPAVLVSTASSRGVSPSDADLSASASRSIPTSGRFCVAANRSITPTALSAYRYPL